MPRKHPDGSADSAWISPILADEGPRFRERSSFGPMTPGAVRKLNRSAPGGIVRAMQISRRSSRPPQKRALLQRRVGTLRLVLQGNGHPSDAEVEQHIAEAVAMADYISAVLVVADGENASGPDARQRSKMAQAGLLRVPTAVVTDSVLARGIMTAVSWLGAQIRGFSHHQLAQAFEFLQLSESVRARVPEQLEAMRGELRGSPPLTQPPSAPPARSFDPTVR